ncbi:MAG: tetratricopeptide repeat protein [Elusimicrobia bacterium]|nr:tetratricopeptide repeat protein [Elusimicrobiota bacterium]
MRTHAALRVLDRLGQGEKLESLCARLGTPFIPEYELEFFRKVYHAELMTAYQALERELEQRQSAPALAARGRLRRILADKGGAARDLNRALDLAPDYAQAHAWLAELDLPGPDSQRSLSRAIALDGGLPWSFLYRAAARLLACDPAGAKEDLARLLKLEPRGALGWLLLGLAEEKLRARASAAKAYAEASRRNPGCSAAYLLRSRAETGRRAARACESALDADPTYALITLSKYRPGASWDSYLAGLRRFAFKEPERAGWYYRQEDIHYSPYQFQEYEDSSRLRAMLPRASWAAALVGRGVLRCPPDAARARLGLRALRQAARAAPQMGWMLAWRALAEIKARRPERALRDFCACVRLQPYYHRAYAWRGSLLRNLGRASEALEDLDRAVAVDEQYPFAAHERSLARRAVGDFVGAALDLDRAFRLDFRYSWVFTAGREPGPREFEGGLAELDRAVARHPHVPSLLVWRGQLRLQRREFSRAFMDFEQAVHLDPHHALAHGWHGRGLVDSGQPKAARAHLARAVELEPEAWIFRGWLAEAEFRAGAGRRAFKLLDGVLRAKPKTWWVHHQRAQIHLAQGRPRRALREVSEALGYEGRHADGYYLEAQARLELSDLSGALAAVEKALTISPNMGRAYLLRARIRERQGSHEGVLRDYRTVHERFPYLFNPEQRKRVAELLS